MSTHPSLLPFFHVSVQELTHALNFCVRVFEISYYSNLLMGFIALLACLYEVKECLCCTPAHGLLGLVLILVQELPLDETILNQPSISDSDLYFIVQ